MKEFFIIPGTPQGKARARTFYHKQSGRVVSMTPEGTVLYENLIKTAFTENCKERWFNKEPLEVTITAFYPIPKSTTKRNRALIAEGKLYPTKKPDADNIGKVICDALNGVAYTDDTQVVRLVVNKVYAKDEPKVLVYINKYN